MASFSIGAGMPEYGWFEDFYDKDSLALTTQLASSAIFEDVNGASIVLSGTGLTYANGKLSGGTVESVQFLSDGDLVLINVEDGNFNATKLGAHLSKNHDLWAFMSALSAGNDTITGPDIGASLNFGDDAGNDIITAGANGCFIGGSKGRDTLIGGTGDGWDTLSYEETFYRSDDKHGITLNTAKGTVIDSWGDKDTISGFEELRGSVYVDKMTGSGADEVFMGMKGNDVINGAGGTDELRYHKDVDFGGKKGIIANLATGIVVDGFGTKDHVSNIERVYGTYKADVFVGDSHDNTFRGLSGKDSFNGGGGTDEVSFDWWEDLGQHGVNVDLSLSKNQIKDDGFGNTETAKSIESLWGGAFADTLKLGAANGWVGGNGGNDTLIAGTGIQWFSGGAGADTFVFATLATLGNSGDNWDEIDDFSQADIDRIDLSGVGELQFKGAGAFGGEAGEIRYEISNGTTIISGDLNGDTTADFKIRINAEITLVGSDFTL